MTTETRIPLDKRRFIVNAVLIAAVCLAATGIAVARHAVDPGMGVVIAVFSVAMSLFISIAITGLQQTGQAWRAGVIGRADVVQALGTMLGCGAIFATGLIHWRLPGIILGVGLLVSVAAWIVNRIRGGFR